MSPQSLKDLDRFLEILKQQRPLLTERYQVKSLSVFGSYLRREQRADSDLDILVTFHETPGLFKFIALENYLSDVLGVKVDLVMQDALKSNIGRHIMSQAIPV